MIGLLQKRFTRKGIEEREKKEEVGKRVEWIDALKGVSILLVVFCHYVVLPENTIVGNVVMALAWAAVPCFMMVSGAVMHQSEMFEWRKHFLKIGKTYVVLCIWRLIYLLIHIRIQSMHFGRAQLLSYLFFLTDLDGIDTGVMWYMNAYLVMLFLFPVTRFLFCEKFQGKHIGREILVYMAGISAVGGIIIPSVNWGLERICIFLRVEKISINGIAALMPFVNHGNLLFYFLAGAFIFEYREWVKEKFGRYKVILFPLICAGTMGLVLVKYIDSGLLIWGGVYLSEGYSHMMTSVISVGMFLLFMWHDWEWRHVNHFLATYIGRHTMGIYYMHYILLAVCSAFIYPMIQTHYSFAMNVIKTVIVTAFCVMIIMLLKKIPWVKNLF